MNITLSYVLFHTELGIRIDSNKHISSIAPGSLAAEEATLAVGDKIISVRTVNSNMCKLL